MEYRNKRILFLILQGFSKKKYIYMAYNYSRKYIGFIRLCNMYDPVTSVVYMIWGTPVQNTPVWCSIYITGFIPKIRRIRHPNTGYKIIKKWIQFSDT